MKIPARGRIREFLRQMNGHEPSESAIDDAIRGYQDAAREANELQRTLTPDKYKQALDAEASHLIDQIYGETRKPN